MFYIYIIYSESADKYYTGHTDDPERRLFEHNNIDKVTYTSKYRPWEIVFIYSISESRSEAIIIERYLKNRKSKIVLKKLIEKQKDTVFLIQFFNKILNKHQIKKRIG
jgi:putative endonuclease